MHPNPALTSLPHLNYWWVFIASLLLSAWLIMMDPLINRDAIIYLRAADAYLQQGFAASQQLHGRPILPVCIALLHQLTGLPMLWAGLLITTLSYALMCTGFVAVVHTLGGNRRVQLIAAVVVLSHPQLNHARADIMRDPIYWATLMLALRELLLYCRQPTISHQLRWLVYILLASLFRFEGLFFALLAPFALLLNRELPERGRHCLYLLVPQLLAVSGLAISIALYQQQLPEGARLFPAIEQYLNRLLAFPAEFAAITEATGEKLLRFTATEDAPVAVIAGLIAVLLINLCRAVTWPWVIVLLWGRRAQLLDRFRPGDSATIKAHILISLAYLALFLLINRFMLERYSNQVVIFLLLFLPFILNSLWSAGGWKKYLAITLLVLMSADSLHTGARDKLFIRDATDWVRETTPAQSSVVTNEKYIAWFSKREFDWSAALGREFQLRPLLAQPGTWRDKDYLVIYVRGRDEQFWADFLAAEQLQELRSFAGGNPKKGRVAVVALD